MYLCDIMDGRQEEVGLKLKTARTLKWNTIDKFSSQVLYAVRYSACQCCV